MGKIKAFFICLLVIILAGCGFSPEQMERKVKDESGTEDTIVVGFSQLGSESVFRTANTKSIQNALTEYDRYFLIYNNARQKQENQIKAIRGFISQRVDYIVFAPVTEYGWETVLKEAKEAGIPVILVDRKVEVDDIDLYTTWIGSNMVEEGRKAGRYLEQFLRSNPIEKDDINIIVLRGTEGSSATIGRTKGFREIAQRHPNWHILEEPCADFTQAKGKEVMDEMLEKYSDIDVIISQNDDMTFGAIEALNAAGITTGINGDIFIESFDAGKEALKLVQEGIINVDIECNPLQGNYVADTIWNLENGLTVLKSTIVEENVFTIDNVNDYIEGRSY